jgi:hypothetical protein
MVFLLADVWRQFKSRTPVMGGAIWADEFLADEGRRRVWKPFTHNRSSVAAEKLVQVQAKGLCNKGTALAGPQTSAK